MVNCNSQHEVDEYWEKLSTGGGQKIQCGGKGINMVYCGKLCQLY
jgi:hypothetical protein